MVDVLFLPVLLAALVGLARSSAARRPGPEREHCLWPACQWGRFDAMKPILQSDTTRGRQWPRLRTGDGEIEANIDVPESVPSQSRYSLLCRASSSGKLLIPLERRDGRVVEGARLEIDFVRGSVTHTNLHQRIPDQQLPATTMCVGVSLVNHAV